MTFYDRAQYRQALQKFQDALACCREANDRAGEGVTLNNIGFVYSGLGQYQQALGYYQQALTIVHEIGDRRGEGVTLNKIGAIYDSLGHYQEAAVYRTLGDLYRRIRLERLAEVRYLKASELARQTGDVEGLAVALASLGEVYISLGNKKQALAHWQQALQQYQAIGDVAQTAYLQRRIDETK